MQKEIPNNAMIDILRQGSREYGLKITPQRIVIYQELLKAKDHPSADIIYKRIVKLPD
jgi:Fur family peroxide stress response transcriptional regulator